MARLFLALDLPQNVRHEVSLICNGLPGARWVATEQLHITLHFLGEIETGMVDDLCGQLMDVSADGFDLSLAGVGLFPPRKKPRVLWIGIRPNEKLVNLRNCIGHALKKVGIPIEKRKFSPHLTLARLKNVPEERLARFVAAHNLYSRSSIFVTQFTLYSSILNDRGAVHTPEAVFCFAED